MQRPTGEASLQWMTQECDIRDYVIDKGDAFVVTLHGLVRVISLAEAKWHQQLVDENTVRYGLALKYLN